MKSLLSAFWRTSPPLAIAVLLAALVWIEAIIWALRRDADGAIGRDVVIVMLVALGYLADWAAKKR